ncbi:MAG TPA: recombinase family protein [Dongiaceae bacterium]|nr:recombinase family protein [Dongiaceae bacterium]
MPWGPSTIHGSAKRGNGILNNELYIGKLVWNRQRFIKDPDTGKRVSRLNPETDWVTQDVPELRIVDQELWDQVKAGQERLAIGPRERGANALLGRRRPKYILAGLLKCGCCGAGFTLIGKNLLGCDRIGALETRKAELQAILAEATEPPALLHPNGGDLSQPHCGSPGGLVRPGLQVGRDRNPADPGRPRGPGPGER